MREMPRWNSFSRVYSGLPSFSPSLLRILSVFKKTSRYLRSLILTWGSARWLPGGAGLSMCAGGTLSPCRMAWMLSFPSEQQAGCCVCYCHGSSQPLRHENTHCSAIVWISAGVEGNTVPFFCAESRTILFSFALATSDRHFNYGRSVSYNRNISSSCSKLLVTPFLISRDLLWSPAGINSRGFPSATVFQHLSSMQPALLLCHCYKPWDFLQ